MVDIKKTKVELLAEIDGLKKQLNDEIASLKKQLDTKTNELLSSKQQLKDVFVDVVSLRNDKKILQEECRKEAEEAQRYKKEAELVKMRNTELLQQQKILLQGGNKYLNKYNLLVNVLSDILTMSTQEENSVEINKGE
jgi:RNA-splicing ligase RtcB